MNLIDITHDLEKGRFLVIGIDNFDKNFFVVGDERGYETFEEARAVAICKQKDEDRINGKDNEIAASFYVINSKRVRLYDTKDTGER